MKKLIIAALLVVGMTSFAQEGKEKPNKEKMEQITPEQRAGKHLKKMTKELGLNPDQQAQLKTIFMDQEARKANPVKPTKEEGKALRKEMDAKMKSILTPEQFEKWNAENEKRKAEMKAKKEGEEKGEKKE